MVSNCKSGIAFFLLIATLALISSEGQDPVIFLYSEHYREDDNQHESLYAQ